MKNTSNQLTQETYKKLDQVFLSDEQFEQMWNKVQHTVRRRIINRVKYYSVAASVAAILGITGSILAVQASKNVQTQYEIGKQALNQVSYYMNKGTDKLSSLEHVNSVLESMKVVKKTEKEFVRMQHIKNLSIIEIH